MSFLTCMYSYWIWIHKPRTYIYIYIYIWVGCTKKGAFSVFYTTKYSIKCQKWRLKNVPFPFFPSFIGFFGQIGSLEAAMFQKFPMFYSISWIAYFYSVSGSWTQNSWPFWTPFRPWNPEMLENIGESGMQKWHWPKNPGKYGTKSPSNFSYISSPFLTPPFIWILPFQLFLYKFSLSNPCF